MEKAAFGNDMELRELGRLITEVAKHTFCTHRHEDEWRGGGIIEHEGSLVWSNEQGGREVTFAVYSKDSNAVFRWGEGEELPGTPVELGAMLAGILIGDSDRRRMGTPKPVRCSGTIQGGKLDGKPCGKFLGQLTAPYRVPCPRCHTWITEKGPEKREGDAR